MNQFWGAFLGACLALLIGQELMHQPLIVFEDRSAAKIIGISPVECNYHKTDENVIVCAVYKDNKVYSPPVNLSPSVIKKPVAKRKHKRYKMHSFHELNDVRYW